MNLKQIKRKYQEAGLQKQRWEHIQSLLKELYGIRKKMIVLTQSSKYGHLIRLECEEKFGDGEATLAFCIERCVIKCKSYAIIKKRHPKLMKYVAQLNAKYFKIQEKIKESILLTTGISI